MTAISREQPYILVGLAARRALTPDQADELRACLDAAYAAIDRLDRTVTGLRATVADYEQIILSQRTELIAAQKASTR